MATTIQANKSLINIVLVAAACFPLSAMALSNCGQGDIKVGSKTVGKASLWMADCQQAWQQQDVRLVFNYSAAIPAWAFKKAANVILKRNLPKEMWQAHQKTFDQITQQYQPIKAGDVYQLDYQAAGKTLALNFNGQLQGRVQGDIVQQYFLIWFGDKPFNSLLKKQLLG